MRTPVITCLLWTLAAVPSSAQVVSEIGDYLAPWGAVGFDPLDMTDDGEWIAFVESNGGGCSSTNMQRISLIRADGTGYSVVVDEGTLELLEPDGETLIDTLDVSDDAMTIIFSWPDKVSGCAQFLPFHYYLVDVPTGQVSEITFNGQVVADVTMTDDGQTMAFRGYDPRTDTWDYYLSGVSSNPGLSDAVPLDVAPGLSISVGKISGDGSAFVFVDPVCCPAELYVHDFGSGVTTTVTPAPLAPGIALFDISDDGQRVIYASEGLFFGVASDGTGHHVIVDPPAAIASSLSGDGSYLLYSTGNPLQQTRRVPWSGGSEVIVPLVGGSFPNGVPSHEDGSTMPGWDFQSAGGGSGHVPVAMWFETPPVLTTFGFGVPGTTITWDVGGEPGDPYVLVFSWIPAAVPFQGYGILGVDPGTLQILTSGVVNGPNNVGQLSVAIPAGLVVPFSVDVYFQALVLGQTGALSNTTTFTISPAAMLATVDDPSSPAVATIGGIVPGTSARHVVPRSASATDLVEEALWRDPAFWMAELRAGRTPSRPFDR